MNELATTLLAHHDGWHHGGWFPWFPLVPLFFIGLWVTVFWFVGRRWRTLGPRDAGERVLAERYARGEIDEHELRQRRAVLRDTK